MNIGQWEVNPDILRSQYGQDRWVLEHLSIKTGMRYIDIGAHDGFHLSNTWALHCLGWRGILVDPSQKLALAKRREGDIFDDRVIWEYNGDIRFSENGVLGRVDHFSGRHMQAITMTRLLELYEGPFVRGNNVFDYLSLDVEGAEVQILRAFFKQNNNRYQFRTASIEFGPDTKDIIIGMMELNGYRHADTLGGDLMFLKEGLS